MSYTPRGVRSTLMHRRGIAAFGFGDDPTVAPVAAPTVVTYNAQSDCTLIPAGDPYRVPGNQCTNSGSTYTFDATGTPVKISDNTIFGLTPTSLAIGAAGGLVLIMLLNKKKGR